MEILQMHLQLKILLLYLNFLKYFNIQDILDNKMNILFFSTKILQVINIIQNVFLKLINYIFSLIQVMLNKLNYMVHINNK